MGRHGGIWKLHGGPKPIFTGWKDFDVSWGRGVPFLRGYLRVWSMGDRGRPEARWTRFLAQNARRYSVQELVGVDEQGEG